jgi:hypothetical protein
VASRTPRRQVVASFLGAVVLTASLLGPWSQARADIVPYPISTQLQDARLSGEGVMRWLGLKVYTARLWMGATGLRTDRPTSQPLALVITCTPYERPWRAMVMARSPRLLSFS